MKLTERIERIGYKIGQQRHLLSLRDGIVLAMPLILAGSIFVIIASLIIFNTIRMAIFNRREEIYMMKLIGANKSFIAGPFLVEAVICGTIAAILASIIGYTIIFLSKSRLEAYGIIISPVISFLQVYGFLVVLGLIFIGSFIGVVSAFTATRKYLKI